MLVNNAAIMHFRSFVDSDEEEWRHEIEANIFSALRLTHGLVPGMIARRAGRDINISSILAHTGRENAAIYSATKSFIFNWTKSLAIELGPHNINVNAVGPGYIFTDMSREVFPTPEHVHRQAQQLPLRRFGTPRDVAECVLFLATEPGQFLTGQMLSPNGGGVM